MERLLLSMKGAFFMQKKQHKMIQTKKITLSAIVIALYIVIMFITQSYAFGQYQVRIATSLYALAALEPFLIAPLGIANFLSNTLMGGLGWPDMLGGFLVGILTASTCYLAKKIHIYLVALPILIFPTLLVPLWLSYLLGIPYGLLVIHIGIGQIVPAILGVFLVKYLEAPYAKLT